jgi:hypothetical protein
MGLVAHGAGSRVLFYGGVLLCASSSLRIGAWVGAFANFGTPPSIGYFSEIGYLVVVVGALRGVWLLLLWALLLTCYLSVAFVVSLTRKGWGGISRFSVDEGLTITVLLWAVCLL